MGRVSRSKKSKNQIGAVADVGVEGGGNVNGKRHHNHHHHQHRHHHNNHSSSSASKLMPNNPASRLKNMLPKQGSYDLNNTSVNSMELDEDVLNINNDKIRLNSAEPLYDYDSSRSDIGFSSSSRFDTMIVKPDHRGVGLPPPPPAPQSMPLPPPPPPLSSQHRPPPHFSMQPGAFVVDQSEKIEFPKKRTCFGLPLTCFAYFAAVYSIVRLLLILFSD